MDTDRFLKFIPISSISSISLSAHRHIKAEAPAPPMGDNLHPLAPPNSKPPNAPPPPEVEVVLQISEVECVGFVVVDGGSVF